MSREEAQRFFEVPPECDPEIVSMVKKRLGFTDQEFDRIMSAPKRTYREFKTYKPTFERMRPLFWLLYKLDLVPKSFYVKYTAKSSSVS